MTTYTYNSVGRLIDTLGPAGTVNCDYVNEGRLRVELGDVLADQLGIDPSRAAIAADDIADIGAEAGKLSKLFGAMIAAPLMVNLDDLLAEASVAIYYLSSHWRSLLEFSQWDPDLPADSE